MDWVEVSLLQTFVEETLAYFVCMHTCVEHLISIKFLIFWKYSDNVFQKHLCRGMRAEHVMDIL